MDSDDQAIRPQVGGIVPRTATGQVVFRRLPSALGNHIAVESLILLPLMVQQKLMSTVPKIPDSKARRQGFQPIGQAATAVRESLRERLLRAVAEDRAEFLTDAEDDAVRCKYPMPIELLMEGRWDDAVETAWADSNRHVSDQRLVDVLEALLHRQNDTPPRPPKEVWAGPVGRVAEALEAFGQVSDGIAWRMLQADPAEPWTFARFMPQLEHLVRESAATLPPDVVREVTGRLVHWRKASNGDYVESKFSIFRIAAVEVERQLAAVAELAQDDTVDVQPKSSVWDKMAERAEERKAAKLALPGIVAIPMEKSTKLERGPHAAFIPLVGAHLPHVLAPDLAEVRRALLAEYPHAPAVIDLLIRDLREDRPAVIKPVLIVGEPGGGKSRIARRLAEMVGLYCYRFDGAGSADSRFSGSSKTWSTTTPSIPARALSMARSATVMVMIDEIEKSASADYNGNLWNALTPFLESETSRVYRDSSLDCEVNLSFVSYVCTANSIDPLPGYLRDRFRVVKMPMPTLDHLPQLAAGVLREIEREADEVGFNAPLEADELEVIGRVWKRERFSMRKLQKLVSATLDARATIAPRH
jgi:ATP-dependent Lon protease